MPPSAAGPSLFYSCWPWRPNICLSNNFYSDRLAADWYLRHTHKKKDPQHLRAGHSSPPGWISGRWRSRAGHYVLFLLQSITIHLFQRSDRALIWRGIITALFKSRVSFFPFFLLLFFFYSPKLCVLYPSHHRHLQCSLVCLASCESLSPSTCQWAPPNSSTSSILTLPTSIM